MVKPDLKHNYYADLELPITASIDDIRKAYRKLALQYHPDRNSGREDQVVPKFQAIQAANEVLGDPASKEKYDTDRRNAGFCNFNPSRTGTPTNPYAAYSAYPPPPRRSQNPTWQQRPQPGPGPPPTPGAATNGADRYSNYPHPTSKKDPARDRMNAFRAWQNMNNTERPRPTSAPQQPPPQPSPQPHKTRPQPPPRTESRMPPDDFSRSGAKYKVPPPYTSDGAEKLSSAWASSRQGNASRPGMPTSNAYRSPHKQRFNPNAPGSDEKAAPAADRYPQSTSPTSSRTQRPSPNPQRPFAPKIPDDQVPFAEGNRERTPYTRSFYDERPDFLREGLRRAHSFRDASKPSANSASPRARSSSPRRTKPDKPQSRDTFDTRESSENELSSDQEARQDRVNGESTSHRPKKVPTRPSRRYANGSAYGAQSDTEQPRAKPNMYAPHSPSSIFSTSLKSRKSARTWPSASTLGAQQARAQSKIPAWAIPSSVNPSLRSKQPESIKRSQQEEFVTGADEAYIKASEEERAAFWAFQHELAEGFENVPGNLDMEVFLILPAMSHRQESSGDALLDRILQRLSQRFEPVHSSRVVVANDKPSCCRFSYTHNPDLYASTEAKSRSEENINTNFSPDGWSGTFTGEPEYFAETDDTAKSRASTSRRPTPSKHASSQHRSATLDVPSPGGKSTSYEQVPQRPWGSDGTPSEVPRTAASSTGFNGDQWRRDFQDSGWGWPPPPPNPPNLGKGGRKQSQVRKTGQANARYVAESNSQSQEQWANDAEDSSEHGAPANDGDAMDIDDAPPAQQSTTQLGQGDNSRVYAEPSESRQTHEHGQRSRRRSSAAAKKSSRSTPSQTAAKFNANLDDLRDAVSQRSTKSGALNFADMESALPFESQASGALAGNTVLPRDLKLPAVPKAPSEPQRLTKISWHNYASTFGEYVKAFHRYNTVMLQHFEGREQQVQGQMASGMGWLEATGDTSGMITAPTGFGQYLRGVKEDRVVREAWNVAWDKYGDALLAFEKVRDRVRKLAVGGMLVEH